MDLLHYVGAGPVDCTGERVVGDDGNPTKRARQKQRRRLRLEAERLADNRARRRRRVAFGLAALAVVGAAGAGVANVVRDRAEVAARQRAVAANLDNLGCTAVEELPSGGTQHFDGAELVSNPPEVAYPDRPAAGGRMAPGVAEPGVYEEPVDERLLVHNLEHGFVTVYHGPGALPADVQKLRDLAGQQSDRFGRLIVAPWTDPLPDDANFAVLSWGRRQLCRDYDADLVLSYIEQNHGARSGAPEAAMAGAANDANPVRPGGDGPFLLPPLTGESPSESGGTGSEAPASDGESTEGGA